MKKYFTIFLIIIFGIVTISATNSVADENADDGFILEEITVTAKKRKENQQKVALAMDVIVSEDMTNFGKNNLNEILSTISSAIIQRAEDGLRVSIRGVNDYTAAGDNQPVATPTVAINVDGVTSNRKDTGNGLYDLERVEVLYGPQSTLYANQSLGGIVNVVTANPKLEDYEVSATVEIGNYDLLHTEGAVNAPLSDTVAIRAAFTSSVRDAYLTNGGDDEDTKSARFKTLYEPNENFSIIATAEISRDGGAGYSGGVIPFVDDSDRDNPWEGEETGSVGVNDQTRKKFFATIDWNLGFADLTILPSYMEGDGYREMIAYTPFGNEEKTYEQNMEDKMVEVHLNSSPSSRIEWIIGAIYYKAIDQNTSLSDEYIETGDGDWKLRDMTEEQKAVFANIKYPLTEQLRLTAGIRRSWDEYFMIQKGTTVINPDTGSLAGPEGTVQLMESPDTPDLNFGFEYDINDNSMLYASYTSAYHLQGQYLHLDEAEKLVSYQIGAKNRFFDNRVQVNGSIYYYDYENFLARKGHSVWLEDTDEDMEKDQDELTFEPYAANQGDGRMLGFDLQTTAILTGNDRLDLSISYIDSEWTEMLFDYYYNEQLSYYDYATNSWVWESVPDESYTGDPMTLTPPWTVNLLYSHDFHLQNGGSINARFGTRYSSDYRITWNKNEYPMNYQEAYHIENASVGYNSSDGKWTVSSYINNIFEYPVKQMYRADSEYLTISEPRTYGMVFSIKY